MKLRHKIIGAEKLERKFAASSKVEDAVKMAVEKEFPSEDSFTRGTVGMISRWILGGLSAQRGGFLVDGISGAKFTYTDKDNMKFTAKVVVSLAPKYDQSIEKNYRWVLKGKNYRGKIE